MIYWFYILLKSGGGKLYKRIIKIYHMAEAKKKKSKIVRGKAKKLNKTVRHLTNFLCRTQYYTTPSDT